MLLAVVRNQEKDTWESWRFRRTVRSHEGRQVTGKVVAKAWGCRAGWGSERIGVDRVSTQFSLCLLMCATRATEYFNVISKVFFRTVHSCTHMHPTHVFYTYLSSIHFLHTCALHMFSTHGSNIHVSYIHVYVNKYKSPYSLVFLCS